MEIKEITSSAALGLTSDGVKAARERGETNKIKEKHGKSYLRIVSDNLFTFFNLVWAVVAIIMIAFKSFGNLTFAFVVVPNILLAIIQEARAKAAVDKLSVTTDPRATVLRDGQLVDIKASDIVKGDVMKLEISRQILSDSIVVSGICEVNESMLTGESVPVKKQAGDRLFAGSFLVSGSVMAEVDRVGKDNYINTLESAAKKHKKPTSNLFRSLDKLIKTIGIFMVPMTAAVAVCNYFVLSRELVGFELARAVAEKTCGAVIGMIPAGMYLLITVTLSLSVMSLARKKTLVSDMYSIEMLARADVLCLDKTGTITDGTMRVCDVVSLDGTDESEIGKIMAHLEGEDDAVNATSKALVAHFGRAKAELNGSVPFSSSRKYSAADMVGVGIYAIGAPHFVPCEVSEELEREIEAHAERGERVLLLARLDSLEGAGTAVALVALEDRIRPGAEDTIRRFQEQDVTVKVISGDHAGTVSSIAKKVGIVNAERYISCEELSDEELVEAAEKYAVFGRVTPEQKVLLVKTMKAAGHTVAMTGDGVNDTLALKESNCAIAMADGSEVARAISQIVLMDSDFSHLPEVVREGRRCINNVRGSASLFVMKTIFTILVSVFSVFVLQTAYPFAPKNFLFLEFFVIGIASFLLAFEPNNERIRGNFLEYVISCSLPYAIAMLIPTFTLLLVHRMGGGITTGARDVLAMLVVTFVGFINLTNICRPYTKWRAFVATGIGAFLALGIGGVALLDHFALGGSEFGLGYALEDPLMLVITMAVGALSAYLMHIIREPLGNLVGRIGKKIATKK